MTIAEDVCVETLGELKSYSNLMGHPVFFTQAPFCFLCPQAIPLFCSINLHSTCDKLEHQARGPNWWPHYSLCIHSLTRDSPLTGLASSKESHFSQWQGSHILLICSLSFHWSPNPVSPNGFIRHTWIHVMSAVTLLSSIRKLHTSQHWKQSGGKQQMWECQERT